MFGRKKYEVKRKTISEKLLNKVEDFQMSPFVNEIFTEMEKDSH